MPPSPRLSARSISSAYFSEMIRISAHRISDTTPRIASGASGPPWAAAFAASFSAERGLGPISTWTTPSAPIVAAQGSAPGPGGMAAETAVTGGAPNRFQGYPRLSRPSARGARSHASVRRGAANYHEICRVPEAVALWRAVCGYQPGFLDGRGLFAGGAQAGCLEVRPSLLRTVRTHGVDIQPVGFGQRHGHAGFDLRGKPGKNGKSGSDKRSDGDC